MRLPSTDFHAPVRTVLPCQGTSSGVPTLTDSNLAMRTSCGGGTDTLSARAG